MAEMTYQQRSKQSTRMAVSQRRSEGGRILEDNRGAFAAKQLKQSEPVQRVMEDEEESLQGKFTDQAPAQLEQQPAATKQVPNNTGMPDHLKSGIESLSGMSMDNVKVHYNSSKPAQLQALAYAQGTDIHLAPGQEQHLPHEAWHVVQQAQGRVKPTMQMKGVAVNDDQGLEREADVMGGRATGGGVVQSVVDSIRPVVAVETHVEPIQLSRSRRSVTDHQQDTNIRNEMDQGVIYDEYGNASLRENPEPGTLSFLSNQLSKEPKCKISFAFMVRTPNFLKDKLKGEDGHAAVQLYIDGSSEARIQVGLGGAGQIAKEPFADSYSRGDNKYTISVYHCEIDHYHAQEVIKKLRKDAGSGHKYSRLAHSLAGSINCATWAIEVARVAGFSFPLTYVLGSNPLFLGAGLKAAMWDRREYTKENPEGKEIDGLEDSLSHAR